jgi:myo-inositol 2-dehydrogenase / D-chiro-inositol 1-dehydrogenase
MTISFALLGAGRIGKVHAKAITSNPDARLVAVADAFPAAAKEVAGRYGCEVRTVDEIEGASDIDAVVICTPTDTHADLIERFARAGKAIFCEKPVDLSLARVKACLKVVEETGAKLMVGFNRRFDPHFAAVRKAIDDGRIGEVEMVQIVSRDPGAPPVSYIKRSGGIFRDMTIHDFDMARFMLGEEPMEVVACASVLVDPAIGGAGDFDSVSVILTTASGKHCSISNSRRATYGYDQRVEAHGSKGSVAIENQRPEDIPGFYYQFTYAQADVPDDALETIINDSEDLLVVGSPCPGVGKFVKIYHLVEHNDYALGHIRYHALRVTRLLGLDQNAFEDWTATGEVGAESAASLGDRVGVFRLQQVGPIGRRRLDDVGVHFEREHAVIVAVPVAFRILDVVGDRVPGRDLVGLDEAFGLGLRAEGEADVDHVGRLRALVVLVGADRLKLVRRAGVRIELVDGDLRILRLEAGDDLAITAPVVSQRDGGEHAFRLSGRLEFGKVLRRDDRRRHHERRGGEGKHFSREIEHMFSPLN